MNKINVLKESKTEKAPEQVVTTRGQKQKRGSEKCTGVTELKSRPPRSDH